MNSRDEWDIDTILSEEEVEQNFSRSVLNLGAGKFYTKSSGDDFAINLDTGYYLDVLNVSMIERSHREWKDRGKKEGHNTFFVKMDAFEFMERYKETFDTILINRFLEHIPLKDLLYFIYLMSTSVEIGGYVLAIVPNYRVLAQAILSECVENKDFPSHDILVTTELLNEPSCPHASIWTPARALYYMELEGRFKVTEVLENYNFDGRDIYMYFEARRIK